MSTHCKNKGKEEKSYCCCVLFIYDSSHSHGRVLGSVHRNTSIGILADGCCASISKTNKSSTADMSKSFAVNVKKQETNHTHGPEAMSNSLNGQKATHIPIGYKRHPGLQTGQPKLFTGYVQLV